MATRDFDAYLAEKRQGRPEFTLGGQKFTCRSKLPWKKFQGVIMSMSVDDDTSTAEKTEEFVRLCLVKEDRDRFMTLVNSDGDEDEDAVIDVDQVTELMNWLVEQYTGKAVESTSSSANGADTTGLQPKSVSLNPTQTT